MTKLCANITAGYPTQKAGILISVLLLTCSSAGVAEVDSVDAAFPEKPSMVPEKLLGVGRDNWRTFGISCSSLDEEISLYADDDRWGTVFGETSAKMHWVNCLESIQDVKNALRVWKETKPKVFSIRDAIADQHSKEFPLITINRGIANHLRDESTLDKDTLYAIDVYRPRYRILQKFENGEALFVDTEGQWPAVYFVAPDGVSLKEGVYINGVADYYSYRGIAEYLNRDGFERKAFVFKGYTDSKFREVYVRAVEARQWIDGDVSTEGM